MKLITIVRKLPQANTAPCFLLQQQSAVTLDETDEIVGEIKPAGNCADDRQQNVADERVHDRAEGRADDHADREIDDVAPHRKIF
jgi:hypothetical protein